MSKFLTNRRSVLIGGAASLLAAPSILKANTLVGGLVSQTSVPLKHGTVTVSDFGDGVKLHSYQSPAVTSFVTTQVIETPERLVFVDGQRSRVFAQEVRDYAEKATGKPVDRMIITHVHPDHWFGAEQFRDVPLYTFAEVKADIEQWGDVFLGVKTDDLAPVLTEEHLPPATIVPENILKHNEKITIDGVELEFRFVKDAESENMMTVFLPKQRALIAQDVLYNNCHLFVGHLLFDGWLNGLRSLQADTSFDIIFPGHGSVTGSRQAVDESIAYIELAKAAYARVETGEEFKNAILERYPSYAAAPLLDIQNLFMFPKK